MTRPLALVVCVAFLGWSGVAWAKPKVALTPFDGDGAGDVRDAVAQALDGKELSVIGNRDVNRAIDKLGAGLDLAEKDLKRLATDLEADAVITAKLEKAGATKSLKFKLYVHKKVVKGFTVSFKDIKSEKFRSALRDKIADKIATTPLDEEDKLAKKKPADEAKPKPAEPAAKPAEPAAKPAPDAGDALAKPTPDAKATSDVAIAPTAATGDADASKQVAVAATPAPASAATVTAHAAPVRSANLAAARVDVGVSMAQRSFSFNANAGSAQKNTTLSLAPGARVEAELYPLAILRPGGMLANLGLGGNYDQTFGLDVAASSQPNMTTTVTQTRYSIGLRYRHAFGSAPTSATIVGGVGFGKRTFRPDLGKLAGQAATDVARDTPETDYTIIDPGVTFRKPITPRIAVSLGARGLLITSAGAIADGDSYGDSTVYGADVVAAAEYLFAKRFVARLAAEFTQIGFSFDGNGALASGVAGLTDRSIGGTASVAVVY